jgi:hypothetical protein
VKAERKSFGQHLAEVYTEPNTGCWIWPGPMMVDKLGYGQTYYSGSREYAHRASYRHHKGSIPEGMYVLHRCDVRSCVNPDHLRLGTHLENMADISKRGGSPKRTITDDLAQRIWDDPSRTCDLVRKYGVSRMVVDAIKSGRTYKGINRNGVSSW